MGSKKPLQKLFAGVPRRYDLINRLSTFGLDARWRQLAVEQILATRPARVLDLCSGTGDLAAMLARAASSPLCVFAVDFTRSMLDEAVRKIRGIEARDGVSVEFLIGDASSLPFEDGTFDAVGIGFGLRNLIFRNTRAERHLAEIFRVMRPGASFVTVESSQPSNALLRAGAHAYMRGLVGPLGGLISKERAAYRYLATSVSLFHTDEQLEQLLVSVGFEKIRHLPRLGGVAAIHIATKP